ncbi:MAG: class I SAM-dependent methyltransferase, partial [Deltaproteobacteria bacterium]|nr:class I SAM-dependent methyltransferase [Deltaproteobacteria bacterium]
LGCGAGFPGLPLAIVRPADRFLLVEARQKKVLFVRQVIDRLQLRNVASIHLHLRRGNGRNELGSPVAVMVTRALSLAGEVLPAAAGMLAAGGRLLLSATAGNREVFHRQLAASGFLRLVREQEVEIPFLGQRRYLLLAEKIGKQEDG